MPALDSQRAALRAVARPLIGSETDYDPLIERVGDARFVLLGEATHGTHEFYRERATITRRLIEECGFNAVAIEGDWPDAYRVDRYVRAQSDDRDADAALDGFRRFPTWMWRNTDVVAFVEWLRAHNATRTDVSAQAGFYGLDLYSLHASIDAVLDYLDRADPAAAARARSRYACFDHFGEDPQKYGYATQFGFEDSCENAVVEQLVELHEHAGRQRLTHGRAAGDEHFFAEQNARLVRNAEAYYRSMFAGRTSSWNLRDTHMMETLTALADHVQRRDGHAKIVVWAHNSHLGDARATDMGRAGEINLGQLVREKYGDGCVLVGFTTYTGSVSAASDWGGAVERKHVRPGLPGSCEALLHRADMPAFYLDLKHSGDAADALRGPLLQRAIGVIYRPDTERQSHYFNARLLRQFDALIHIDESTALRPLDATPEWHGDELPETYPFGT